MRRIPIRMKLAAALAVPLGALAAVTLLEVLAAANQASKVREQSALVEVALGPSSVLATIELERNAVSVYVLGQEGQYDVETEDHPTAIQATDEAVDAFRAEVERQGADVVDAYAPALASFGGLGDLRARVAAVPVDDRSLDNFGLSTELFTGYSAIMDDLAEANSRVNRLIDDTDLRQGAELVTINRRQRDLVATLAQVLFATQLAEPADGVNTPEEISAVAQDLTELRGNWDLMASKATGKYEPLVDRLITSDEAVNFPPVVDAALASGTVDMPALITAAGNENVEALPYNLFSDGAKEITRDRADELEAAASRRQQLFVTMALLVVGAASLLAWWVSRSITRPLRSLTQQAKAMAEQRLPEAVRGILETPLGEDVTVQAVDPIELNTRDEVADVADALNTVQETAVDLAVEQAVLRRNISDSFVNLGRRNQNLLGRQLDFITELESNEADPDVLANLFRLDHLATRMRRNAESLLVLAGIEPPRKWAAPVQLIDVIRAALGEVEGYQRVSVRGVEPATVLGSAAADLAHLLAELVENALVFSPPDRTVDVRGRSRPDGYTLAVIDAGLGMPREDLATANRRLAGAESFTIAPSKYLGHYVAGNLAARHGIGVHLEGGPGGGVTAIIDVPPSLLTPVSTVGGPPVQVRDRAAAPSEWPALTSPAGPPQRGHADQQRVDRHALGGPVAQRGPTAARNGAPVAPAPEHGPVADQGRPGGLMQSSWSYPPSRPSLGDMARGLGPGFSRPPAGPAPQPPGTRSPRGNGEALAGHGRPNESAAPDGGMAPEGNELARRVRGAQMPTTAPHAVRRSDRMTARPAAPSATPPQRTPEQEEAADSVYRYLTMFSAGIERGLKETRNTPRDR
ncbi:MAG TPA: ATP-binding protein [Acidimicrobiales bacterium]|nr:ATP-binding protein [Acidimicrobiales bacterium]